MSAKKLLKKIVTLSDDKKAENIDKDFNEFLFNKINTFLEIYRLTGKLTLDYGNN